MDQDVLNFFKAKAQKPNALPYQTQINQALRYFMESGNLDTNTLKAALVQDSSFIQAIVKAATRLRAA
ncbi:MAG: BrnA antitoxin family protein [Gammaproteobacteria bacterium]|nr:BrnA antitoxin family protein [Gammaproteobacteria bacterium]